MGGGKTMRYQGLGVGVGQAMAGATDSLKRQEPWVPEFLREAAKAAGFQKVGRRGFSHRSGGN